jgi:phenylalanyl-tRNA synthetase beta chain
MKVPVRWLSEFIELEEEAEKVAEILTFGGLEVEEVYDHYQTLGEIIAVKVLEVNKPSELKDLAVCTVHDGKDSFTVLTAAVDRVKPGQVLALARPGSKTFFWDKIEVKEVKGYKSWGMFLSPYEAGVSEEKDILLELPLDVKPGENIYKALNISETILDVSITPNRGDCLSVLGLARELSLLTGSPLKEVRFDESLKEGSQPKGSLEILDPDGCFRYVGRWFSGVKVAPSPFFIIKRLVFCGLRPINNLVDITNYVLLELGQPLHAFDWDRVSGGRIIVRRAKEGERLLFLDGVERELSSEDLVIADAEKALVLAGIMGGEESGVSDNTQEVFLESAWFNAKRVRLSGMRHRLNTESSYRFERKVDPEGVYLAMLRATELILRYANPEEVSIIVDEYPVRFTPPRIELKKKRLSAYLGFEIPEEKVKGILNKLGDLEVTPESFSPRSQKL